MEVNYVCLRSRRGPNALALGERVNFDQIANLFLVILFYTLLFMKLYWFYIQLYVVFDMKL